MPDLEILKKVAIFKGLSMDELVQIGKVCEELSFPEYDMIFEEGAKGNELFILVTGKIEIKLRLTSKDKWMTLTKVSPGDIFGEFALFDHSPRSATAVAFTEVTLYKIDGDIFFKLMDDNPRIGCVVMKNMVSVLINRLRTTDAELRNHVIWELVEAGE